MSDTQMHETKSRRWARVLGAVAIIFGLLSIYSGGQVLFGAAAVRTEAGKIVPAIVWSNFLSGFVYVVSGVQLMRWRRSGALIAIGLAAALVLVAALFSFHVVAGGLFEIRTVMAMLLRLSFWCLVAAVACRALGCLRHSPLPDIR
jgi:hypothetical protein